MSSAAPPHTRTPASPLPTVSVVVPTFNRAGSIERILRPLLDDPAATEVIVVVDGCRDGTWELIERLRMSEPRLRGVFIENSGDMAAREAGARAALSEIVLFIDDDVLAEPGLVTGHARRHGEAAADAVVGYMPVKPPAERTADDFATRLYAREYEGRCAIYEREPQSALREMWGGNISMRRRDCLAVGMTNAAFTEHYHADRDFGIRALRAGLTSTFDRTLGATHLHERSLASFIRDARSQGAARMLLPRFHPETVRPPAPREFERNLPVPLAALVAVSRRRRAYRALSAAFPLFIRTAGRLRLWSLQEIAARVLRRIEQQHGAIAEAQRPPAS